MTCLEKLQFDVDQISGKIRQEKLKLTSTKSRTLTNFLLKEITKLTNEKIVKLEAIIAEQERKLQEVS